MSVIAVQAAAGREIVHTNPDKAAEVFARIESVGRESLAELRRMLGVLRETGDEPALAVAAAGHRRRRRRRRRSRPPAACATELVRRGRRSEHLAPGHRAGRLPDRAGGAHERAQARRPLGVGDRARSPTSAHALVVEVTDDGRGAATSLSGSAPGHGLIGMRERVEIYGGELTSGPRPGGGYAVRAVLPVVRRRRRSVVAVSDARPTARRSVDDHQSGDRRRPGADARRLQHDPRCPARHRGRR